MSEADALGVSLGNFGDTLTTEEAAELISSGQGDNSVAQEGTTSGKLREFS